MSEAIACLDIRGLSISFTDSRGANRRVVASVDVLVRAEQTVALVGESGSGKSVTALSVLSLLPKGSRIESGRITFFGRDLLSLSERQLDAVRGNEIGMVFQEPMTALNPTMTIGLQIAETLRRHRGLDGAAARAEAVRLLDLVRFPAAGQRLGNYPHELSGGMRQRVLIAIAVSCRPRLLLADEPTTALDASVQAEVMGLLSDLKREYGLAMLFITHNLSLVSSIADRVSIMYAGEIVEAGSVDDVFLRPMHPYTRALLKSIPRVDADVPLRPISGQAVSGASSAPGCPFFSRCESAMARCEGSRPPWYGDRTAGARCWLLAEDGARHAA